MTKLLVLVLVLLFAVAGSFVVASDYAGEVVVLTTRNEGGRGWETKLWVVEDHGQVWLRSGQPSSEWLARLEAQPRVTLVRDGVPAEYRAVVVPKQRERINRLMAERYGWADRLIMLVRDESVSVPIRLDPIR
jgi:hypothetical protein